MGSDTKMGPSPPFTADGSDQAAQTEALRAGQDPAWPHEPWKLNSQHLGLCSRTESHAEQATKSTSEALWRRSPTSRGFRDLPKLAGRREARTTAAR